MAYDPILEAEIQQDQPVTTDLLQKIKGNFEYLYSIIGSAGGGSGSSSGLPNGSFEIDEDADNIPDTWTRYLYAGGSAAYETVAPGHGAKAYKFTRALGANNGGGYLTSDYVACAAGIGISVSWLQKSSVAGLRNIVQILWYDKAQVYISLSTIYDSTANPTAWTYQQGSAAAPATAFFFRVRLIGGYTDTDVAGTAYWDGVSATMAVAQVNLPEKSITATDVGAWTSAWTSDAIYFDPCMVPKLRFVASAFQAGDNEVWTHKYRIKVGSNYSSEIVMTSGDSQPKNVDAVLEVDISNLIGTRGEVEYQYWTSGIGSGCTGWCRIWQTVGV